MLFCIPPELTLQDENYLSILDTEIKRRLDQAASDSVKVERLMGTPISMVLLEGLRKTFPCTPAKFKSG